VSYVHASNCRTSMSLSFRDRQSFAAKQKGANDFYGPMSKEQVSTTPTLLESGGRAGASWSSRRKHGPSESALHAPTFSVLLVTASGTEVTSRGNRNRIARSPPGAPVFTDPSDGDEKFNRAEWRSQLTSPGRLTSASDDGIVPIGFWIVGSSRVLIRLGRGTGSFGKLWLCGVML
jgi:hypothetical protein